MKLSKSISVALVANIAIIITLISLSCSRARAEKDFQTVNRDCHQSVVAVSRTERQRRS